MNLTIETKVLQEALKTVGVANDAGISLPILSGVKLEAEKGKLVLSATNLELYCTARVPAKVSKGGAIVISHDLLSRLVAQLNDSKIQLDASEKLLIVRSGPTEATFEILPADEFPPEPEQDGTATKEIDAKDITIPFAKVQHSMGNDPARSLLRGINLRPNGAAVYFAATTATRLSVYKGALVTEEDVIAPDQYVKALLKTPLTGKATLNISKGSISIDSGEVKLCGKLIDGKFPNWSQVIPKGTRKVFSCSRKNLINAVRTCSIFTQREMPGLILTGKNNEIEVTKLGKAKVMVLGTDLEGQPDLQLGVNSLHMLDALETLEDDEVRIQCVDEQSTFLIEEGDLREIMVPVVKA